MSRCLNDAKLELLAQGRAPWWRAWLWRRHLCRCDHCQRRLAQVQADEQFLAEVRRAAAAPPKPSPLSEARSRLSG